MGVWRGDRFPSLRRHEPDQVRRVAGSPASQPLRRGAPRRAGRYACAPPGATSKA